MSPATQSDRDASGCIIKICGITRVEDGLCALEAGADWLGFVRWPKSKRFQPVADCAELIAQLRRRAARPFEAVGVYVDAPAELIEAEAAQLGLDRIQLHGAETPDFARALGRPVVRGLRFRDQAALDEARAWEGFDLLVDAWDADSPGGTGRGYEYSLLCELSAQRRLIVAGGLSPANVAKVIAEVGPWGVDVSSGVEAAPGLKDHGLIRAFIESARLAWRKGERI